MKLKLILVIVFDLFLHVATPLPGIDLLMRSFKLLTQEPVTQIVSITYENKFTTPDGKYSVPDGFLYGSNSSCDFNSDTFTSSSLEDYKSSIDNKYSIGGQYKLFSASLTSEYVETNEQINKNNRSVSFSSASCINYNLTFLKDIKYSKLNSQFLAYATQLPSTYESDKNAYNNFINTFGDHVQTSCKVGGWITQHSFTNNTYVKNNSTSKTTTEAKASFYVSVDASKSSSHSVDKEYTTSTVTNAVRNQGGDYPASKDNWAEWAKSVQSHDNLACVGYSAQPIDYIFGLFPELQSKQTAMKNALANFFNRKGCTNPAADNYDKNALIDDGTCTFGCVIQNGSYIGVYKTIIKIFSATCTIQCDPTANINVDSNKIVSMDVSSTNCRIIQNDLDKCDPASTSTISLKGSCNNSSLNFNEFIVQGKTAAINVNASVTDTADFKIGLNYSIEEYIFDLHKSKDEMITE